MEKFWNTLIHPDAIWCNKSLHQNNQNKLKFGFNHFSSTEACLSSPCAGGVCRASEDDSQSYVCYCLTYYHGENCENSRKHWNND